MRSKESVAESEAIVATPRRPPSLVVDIDAHYYENIRKYGKYIDEPWKSRIERWSTEYYVPIEGVGTTGDRHLQGRISRKNFPTTQDASDIPEVMDYLGVDIIVLLPNTMLSLNHLSDRKRAAILCEGFIEHMLDEVVDPKSGIYTVLCLPPQDPRRAAGLVERYAGHDGVCATCMMTDGQLPFPFGDAYYDPIYRAATDAGLPLVMHGGFGGPDGGFSGLGLQSYAENHIAFVVNHQVQLTSIVMQGVPERFPELKIVWEEAGIFWVPSIMYRLDTEYSRRRSDHTLLTKPPSEYILGYFFGTQPIEVVPNRKHLQYIIEMMNGESTLMFATDWPHQDFDHPTVVDRMSFLSVDARRRILGENALGVMRFNGSADIVSGFSAKRSVAAASTADGRK